MRYKRFNFDVEMIIDHSVHVIMNYKTEVSTHRIYRGLNLKQLLELIRVNNNIPKNEDVKVTFNIRGVNY